MDRTPLITLCSEGEYDIAKLFVKRDANINIVSRRGSTIIGAGGSALLQVILHLENNNDAKHYEMISFLRDHGADINNI